MQISDQRVGEHICYRGEAWRRGELIYKGIVEQLNPFKDLQDKERSAARRQLRPMTRLL